MHNTATNDRLFVPYRSRSSSDTRAGMTSLVRPHLGHGEDNSAGNSERSRKERKTEEEIGR